MPENRYAMPGREVPVLTDVDVVVVGDLEIPVIVGREALREAGVILAVDVEGAAHRQICENGRHQLAGRAVALDDGHPSGGEFGFHEAMVPPGPHERGGFPAGARILA